MILYPLAFISRSTSFVTSGMIMQLDAYDRASYSGSGTTVNDLTGSYTHTLTGASFTILDGIRCFDCTTGNNRVVVNGTGPTLPTTGYTYITWARLMSSNSGFRTLLYTNSPKYTPITIPNGAGTLGYWDSSFKTSGYDASSSSDTWVQFAVVGDSSSQTFYINGSQVGSTINAGSGGRTHWGWGNNDTAGQPWGHVANLFLYDRKLSVEEIIGMYNHLAPRFVTPVTSNLVLHYDPYQKPSYAGSGATLYDLTSNSLNGTLSNTSYTSPYFIYNGSSSTMSTSDTATLEPGSGDWTVEVWVNHAVITGASRCIISKTNGGNSADWGYGIRTTSSGSTYMEVGNGTTSITSPSSTLSTGIWYQLVGVWTNVASNSIEFYANGISQGSSSHSFASIKNTTRPVSFGSFDGGATFGQWVNGKIGIVRIYNKSLTSTEVLNNYNADKWKYQ